MNEEKPEVKKTKKSEGSDCPDSPGEATVRCQTPGPQISSPTSSNPSLAKVQGFCIPFFSSIQISESDLQVSDHFSHLSLRFN